MGKTPVWSMFRWYMGSPWPCLAKTWVEHWLHSPSMGCLSQSKHGPICSCYHQSCLKPWFLSWLLAIFSEKYRLFKTHIGLKQVAPLSTGMTGNHTSRFLVGNGLDNHSYSLCVAISVLPLSQHHNTAHCLVGASDRNDTSGFVWHVVLSALNINPLKST